MPKIYIHILSAGISIYIYSQRDFPYAYTLSGVSHIHILSAGISHIHILSAWILSAGISHIHILSAWIPIYIYSAGISIYIYFQRDFPYAYTLSGDSHIHIFSARIPLHSQPEFHKKQILSARISYIHILLAGISHIHILSTGISHIRVLSAGISIYMSAGSPPPLQWDTGGGIVRATDNTIVGRWGIGDLRPAGVPPVVWDL